MDTSKRIEGGMSFFPNAFQHISSDHNKRSRKTKGRQWNKNHLCTWKHLHDTKDKQNAEAKHIDLKYALFADDTTILSNKESMDVARDTTKRVMGLFEEKTNESKEENITLGETSAAGTRFLGLWLGEAEDTRVRLQRGMGAQKLKVN